MPGEREREKEGGSVCPWTEKEGEEEEGVGGQDECVWDSFSF